MAHFISRPRIVCVSNGPLPYHTPILNALADMTSLHVLYMSSGHPLNSFDDLWGETPRYSYSFHPSRSISLRSVDFRTQISIGARLPLRVLNPDVVLVSSWGPLVWEPLVWARVAGRGAVMWAESTAASGLFRGRLADSLRRLIVGLAHTFVANGTRAASYLQALGVASNRIVVSRLPSPLRCNAYVTERQGDGVRLLFVGRLIDLKRPLDVINALERLDRSDVSLTIVGSGPLSDSVALAARDLKDRVTILGRLEGDALRDTYRGSDVLVVPSGREVWGLVVNEGLAQGLYVIASNQIPSAADLLTDLNGRIYPAGNIDSLADAIRYACEEVELSNEARLRRAATVATVTPEAFAYDILKAARVAWKHDPSR